MAERHLIIDHLKFSYEGLLNVAEIYNIIATFFYEKGWDWLEKYNHEMITSSGKQIHWIFMPWKSSSDYYKIQVQIKVNFIDIKEVEVENQGTLLKMNQGVMRMTIDAYVLSDRKHVWTSRDGKIKNMYHWIFALLGEKYLFQNHFTKFETWVKSDIDDVLNKVKSYLNTYKYTYHT